MKNLLLTTPLTTQKTEDSKIKENLHDVKSKSDEVAGEKNKFETKKDPNDESDIPNPVPINSRYADQAKAGEVSNRRYAGKTKEEEVPNAPAEQKKEPSRQSLMNHFRAHLERGKTQSVNNEVTDSPVGNIEPPKNGNDQQQHREERRQLEIPKVFSQSIKSLC